jgi:hypothetical protein
MLAHEVCRETSVAISARVIEGAGSEGTAKTESAHSLAEGDTSGVPEGSICGADWDVVDRGAGIDIDVDFVWSSLKPVASGPSTT